MQFNSLSKMNQLDSDLHLPPRKRLLAGFKKLNESSSSSSTTSNSNGSSSVSTDVQTHLNNLLASPFNNQTSPEELMEATKSAAVLAVKAAKIARAMANEKALISAKAIDSAKIALDLLDSFPKGACKKKNKQKKHVPVKQLYSKEEDLARRLHRTFSDFEENSQRNKKQKNDNDIVGVVDSESFYDGEESSDKMVIKPNESDSNLLSKRRGRVKLLKKLPLSICNTRNQENVTSLESTLPVAQPQENGVVPVVRPGSSSRKCQDLKNQECVKQSKAVRS